MTSQICMHVPVPIHKRLSIHIENLECSTDSQVQVVLKGIEFYTLEYILDIYSSNSTLKEH